MKATTIIIAAVLALQVNVLFAGSKSSYESPVTNENSSGSLISLAPITPAEATFDDNVTLVDYTILAPVTPTEATLEDMPSEIAQVLDLAPVTPAVADFNDVTDLITLDFYSLAPSTPAEADFE